MEKYSEKISQLSIFGSNFYCFFEHTFHNACLISGVPTDFVQSARFNNAFRRRHNHIRSEFWLILRFIAIAEASRMAVWQDRRSLRAHQTVFDFYEIFNLKIIFKKFLFF
jgi:hypothetical protein